MGFWERELAARKVCIIITTRGNYAKMKSVIRVLRNTEGMICQVIVGGGAILPEYGNFAMTLREQGIEPDRSIHYLIQGENPVAMAKSAGMAVTEFSTAFEDLMPDVVVVIADRYESLSIAMAASYMNIPIAHVEGGEVSGSIDESIRHAITKLAHLHFPATAGAAEVIEKLGEDKSTIFKVGSTSLDLIREMASNDLSSADDFQNTHGIGAMIEFDKPYLIVIQHPVTTEYERNLENVNHTINAIEKIGIQTIWIAPNMDAGSDGISKGLRIFRENKKPKKIRFFKAVPIEVYAPLIKNTVCLIGNSSSGIRESSFLGVPTINIGTRQQGRERGRNVVDVPYDYNEIYMATCKQIEHGFYDPDYTYGDGGSAEKIVKVLKDFQFKLQKRICF